MLVKDWMEEKKFPFIYHPGKDVNDIMWFDFDDRTDYAAAGAIVNDPPYVAILSENRRPIEYFLAADPEFFTKLEKRIVEALEERQGG